MADQSQIYVGVAGYFGKPDQYNSRNDSDAAIAFGKGEGALMIGGNWNASTAKDGLGDDATFFNMPPGESGDKVAIGSTSTWAPRGLTGKNCPVNLPGTAPGPCGAARLLWKGRAAEMRTSASSRPRPTRLSAASIGGAR